MAGLFEGAIDGAFGPATQKAVSAFESSRGLPPTGTLTAESAGLLGWKKAERVASKIPEITHDGVIRLFSLAAKPHIAVNLPHVLNALVDVAMGDRQMIAMALATVRVETSLFLPISELPSALNTSLGGKLFDLYDARAGLGNLGAPDGSRFRGRGFIQLTGRANYQHFSRTLNLGNKLVENPYLLHDSAIAARILAAFLKDKESRIRQALSADQLAEARRSVNGGINGLAEFVAAYRLAMDLLPGNREAKSA